MAKQFTVTQLGAQAQTFNIEDGYETVQDVLDELDLSGVSIKVNGQTKDASHKISEYEFISFGEKVKGGAQA